MYEPNRDKITFMTEQSNYKYNAISFGLKNAEATYQRMMNSVFKEEIGKVKILEIFINFKLNDKHFN